MQIILFCMAHFLALELSRYLLDFGRAGQNKTANTYVIVITI